MCIVFVAGVLKESQQWEVHSEGPAGCPDAESPQVPSTSSGRRALVPLNESNSVKPRAMED